MSLRLEITTTPTKWEQTPQPAKLSLQTTLPQVELTTAAAKLEISGNRPGELAIDTTEARAALGLKTLEQLGRDWAEAGRQAALDAAGQFASDGDRLMNFQHGDAIVDLAYDVNLQEPPSIEWGYKPGPAISYTPNRPQFQATPGQVDLQLKRGTVTNDTPPPSIDFRITQYGRVNISVTGSRINQAV